MAFVVLCATLISRAGGSCIFDALLLLVRPHSLNLTHMHVQYVLYVTNAPTYVYRIIYRHSCIGISILIHTHTQLCAHTRLPTWSYIHLLLEFYRPRKNTPSLAFQTNTASTRNYTHFLCLSFLHTHIHTHTHTHTHAHTHTHIHFYISQSLQQTHAWTHTHSLTQNTTQINTNL